MRRGMKVCVAILLLVWITIISFGGAPLDNLARFIQARIAAYTLGAVLLLMYYIDAEQ